MKGQPHRLDVAPAHTLRGTMIDRTKPVKFRLNGNRIDGFDGDTVLSAVMASGFLGYGTFEGTPIALGERFSPIVAPVALAQDGQQALPMDRTPAIDGLDLRTLTRGSSAVIPHAALDMLKTGMPRTLGIALSANQSHSGPWLDIPPSMSMDADIVIVGGGIAGLNAAAEAGRNGASVILLERRPALGGNAILFGRTEDEEGPAEALVRLSSELATMANVKVLTSSEVFSLDGNHLLAHRVERFNGAPRGSVVAVTAPRIVLATGAIERLPVFPGNRLPGVATTADAFHLAHSYGVLPGGTIAFSTVTNATYRLAMLAADAGITVKRIIDHRPSPQTRFLEFCKAYAITMAGGIRPLDLSISRRRTAPLTLESAIDMDAFARDEAPLHLDRLYVSGGWQPDLMLWHMSGGHSRWSPERHAILPTTGPRGTVLAGAAAGCISTNACVESGRDAIDVLFDRPRRPVCETIIDSVYDTPDAPTPIAPHRSGATQPAYLDTGVSLTMRPVPPPKKLLERLGLRPKGETWHLAEQPRALSIADVAAGVMLGAIPAASAGIVAAERASSAGDLVANARQASDKSASLPAPADLVPAFLEHRFGSEARIWSVKSVEDRRLETGSLIFINSDETDPRRAIGVILAPLDGESGSALALIGKADSVVGEGATLRDQGRPVSIRLVGIIENPSAAAAEVAAP